jgi:hypothetical protein
MRREGLNIARDEPWARSPKSRETPCFGREGAPAVKVQKNVNRKGAEGEEGREETLPLRSLR